MPHRFFLTQTVIIVVGLFLFISCQSETNIASPPPDTPEPSIEGTAVLAEAITLLNATDAYQLQMTVSGTSDASQIHCAIQKRAYLCESVASLPDGTDQTMILLQIDSNSWFKESRQQREWTYFPAGFEPGYQGLNDPDLLRQTTTLSETVFAGSPVYRVEYAFEPDPLLRLIFNDGGTGATLVANAASGTTSVATTGTIWLDSETRQPIQEIVRVFIDDPLLPITVETKLVYDFETPVVMPIPTGEQLLLEADRFLAAVRDTQLDAAYGQFSTRARQNIGESTFVSFVAANQDLFAGYESVTLSSYDPAPPTVTNLAGEYRQITAMAIYGTQDPISYRLIFENEADQWRLFRFDIIE